MIDNPDNSHALADLAQRLTSQEKVQLIELVNDNSPFALYPAKWQQFLKAAGYSVESGVMKSADDLALLAASYRAKAAAASDPLLAKGYRALAKEAEADLLKYSPDQPRDPNGRFGSGSGSSSFTDTRTAGGSRSLNPREAEDQKGGSGASHLISDGRGGVRFSPERAALHEQIIQERLAGIPKSDNPTFVMLGGGPASGKSTSGVDKWEDPHVKIDVDSIKAQLPEYDPKNPSFVHEESSYIGKEIMARAYAGNQNILLDGTGNNSVEAVAGKIDTAKAYGYSVEGRYLTVPTEQAVVQDAARSRSVGSEKVYEIHSAVSQVFPGIATKFDSVNLYDSRTKGNPVLVATGGSGKLDIVNQDLYSQFLGKAGDYSYYTESQGRS